LLTQPRSSRERPMSSANSRKTTVKLSGNLSQYRFTEHGREYKLKNWRLTTRHRSTLTAGSSSSELTAPASKCNRESSSSTITVLKSSADNMPDELTILFTPRGLQPLKHTNGNAVLTKSSARREKHDVWGTDFKLGEDINAPIFAAETIHLVARIDKVQTENVQITIT